MNTNASKILIETILKKTIRDIKEAPERNTRNIVDMALQFSKGRFQKQFFSMLQDQLKNEQSAYYSLVRDVVNHVDTNRLITFGINLGFNSCTVGAETIRKNEETLKCNIPWTVILQTDGKTFAEHQKQYEMVVQEGMKLGIYAWMLFAGSQPGGVLPLIGSFPDCAFFLYCTPEAITDEFLDAVSAFHNLMIVVCFDQGAAEACERLRRAEQLYSVYYSYSEADIPAITNGDLFSEMEQLHPAFSVLMTQSGCSDQTRWLVSDLVMEARKGQQIQTVLWELDTDNRMVDQVISEDNCAIYFDRKGTACRYDASANLPGNLFTDSLQEIFEQAFSKQE